MPPKGWTSGRPEGIVKAVRLTEDIVERVARHTERLQAQLPDIRVNEGVALRQLIRTGLDTVEAREAAHPTTEPAQLHVSLPMDVLDVAKPTKAPSSRRQDGKGGSHGIPDELLQRIADERVQCEGLSFRDFAQRLHDRGIYSSTAKDGSKAPADPSSVRKWLERARTKSML
jgi:hypothetical protein